MKLLAKDQICLEWSDLNNRQIRPMPEFQHRTPGVHVSGVLKHIGVKLGKLTGEDERDLMPMCIATGIAMEQFIVSLYPDVIWQPGEVFRDGIVGSPDGKELSHSVLGVPVMHEYKATYKSIRTRQNILDEWLWMHQIMSYCNMDDDRPELAMLHVWWVCGDYTYPLKPQYWRYLIQFSKDDLQSNWAMMQRYKDHALAEV